MKWLKRLSVSISISTIILLSFTFVVLAASGSITNLIGKPTDRAISLTWVKDSDCNYTIIRHSTTGYPLTPSDNTSTYNGTLTYTTLYYLDAGTTYYFSAWGWDGVGVYPTGYSATVKNLVINTLPAVSGNTTIPYPKPELPANVAAEPDSSGWSISPIDDILAYFADPSAAHGGLGMLVDNVIMFMASVGVVFVGLGAYVKWRSFWTSYTLVCIGSAFMCSIGVMQWIVLIFLGIAGWGVWAVDRNTQ